MWKAAEFGGPVAFAGCTISHETQGLRHVLGMVGQYHSTEGLGALSSGNLVEMEKCNEIWHETRTLHLF